MRHLKLLSIYGITVLFNAAISFAVFSILTHHLTKTDYGVINLYSSFLIFLMPFIGIGTQYTIGVNYFNLNEQAFRKYFTNTMIVPVLSCVLFTAIFFLLNGSIQKFLKVDFLFAVTIPLVCLLTIFVDIFLTLFRNNGKHLFYAGFSISKNTIESGLTIFLVLYLGYHWSGRLGSSLMTLILAGVFIAFIIRKWHYYTGNFQKNEMANSFYSGLPFVPERLAIFVLANSDRFFIDHFNGTSTVGLYGAGAQLVVIVSLAISTLNNTFHPILFRNLAAEVPDYKKVRNATFTYLGIATAITLFVIASTPLFFTYLIGPAFRDGKIYAVYLSIGMFFWAVYNAFLPYLLIIKKNKLIMIISIIGMLSSLLFNFINVPHFGALGATYTSIIVYFLMALVTILFVHKHFDLRKVFQLSTVKS